MTEKITTPDVTSALPVHQKNVGLIGGMSWEGSAQYYRLINEITRNRLGSPRSARILMLSVDFGEVAQLQHAGHWDRLAEMMADSARCLERGGADFIVLCCNTMHYVADAVTAAVAIPFLHIVTPTGIALKAAGVRRVGLLGTSFTTELGFYAERLHREFGMEVVVPNAEDRCHMHKIIYEELAAGQMKIRSRQAFRRIIGRLVKAGVEAVILGCTEIMLLVDQNDSRVPLFDTTTLHARAAADLALADTDKSEPMFAASWLMR